MANFLTRLFEPNPYGVLTPLVESDVVQISDASVVQAQSFELDRLREGMSELSLYLEDYNWIPFDGWVQDSGFSIEVIKYNSDNIRALLTVNPTIKKAMSARIGYIWGRGVSFKGSGITKMLDNKRNQRVLFSDSAHERLEKQVATDGNVWMARNKTTQEVIPVPIHEISGWVLDVNDPTRVNYWLRSYSVQVKNFATGVEETQVVKVFYPASDYTTGVAQRIDGIKVDRNIQMVHMAVNRQEGWVLGIPDIMAAMFWAKAHKELFEAGTTYVKAQGKFASKVVSKTRAGAANSAARIAEQPRRDPNSGEVLDIGGTAVMSGGLDMQLMGKMSGGVDFDKFDPVAGLIAAALDVPLSVLIGNSDAEDKSLEASVVNAMQMRQKAWSEFFIAIFDRSKIEVVWPKIRTEPEYRRIQAIEIANRSNTLHPNELRQLTLEGFGIEGDPEDLPDPKKNNSYLMAKALSDNTAKNAEKVAAKVEPVTVEASTPEQGVDAGIGKLADGVDAKASRDNQNDRNTKNE
jgi:hypothetical protein